MCCGSCAAPPEEAQQILVSDVGAHLNYYNKADTSLLLLLCYFFLFCIYSVRCLMQCKLIQIVTIMLLLYLYFICILKFHVYKRMLLLYFFYCYYFLFLLLPSMYFHIFSSDLLIFLTFFLTQKYLHTDNKLCFLSLQIEASHHSRSTLLMICFTL